MQSDRQHYSLFYIGRRRLGLLYKKVISKVVQARNIIFFIRLLGNLQIIVQLCNLNKELFVYLYHVVRNGFCDQV